jgi:hypothetical protein
LLGASVTSQEYSGNFAGSLLKITPAVKGISFPYQETKNPFFEWLKKIPFQCRSFPVSERFAKKIQEFN